VDEAGALPRGSVGDALASVRRKEQAVQHTEAGLDGALDFDAFVEVASQQQEPFWQQQRLRAGFSASEVESFQEVFASYDLDSSGDIDAHELELFLKDAGMAPKSQAEQQEVVAHLNDARKAAEAAGADEVSEPGSGSVRFWELVQLMRVFQQKCELADENEMSMIVLETQFKHEEIVQFREVFVSWLRRESIFSGGHSADSASGLSIEGVRRLLRSIGVSTTTQQRQSLASRVQELAADGQSRLKFAGFLRLMWWLTDEDFAGINHHLASLTSAGASDMQQQASPKRPHFAADLQAPHRCSVQVLDIMSATPSPSGLCGLHMLSPIRTPGALSSSLLRSSQWPKLAHVDSTFFANCRKQDNQHMSFMSFAKLCKECKLIDSSFRTVDADVIFARAANKYNKYQRGLCDLAGFKKALETVAEKKGVDVEDVFASMAAWCDGHEAKLPSEALLPLQSKSWLPTPLMASTTRASLGQLSSWISSIPTPVNQVGAHRINSESDGLSVSSSSSLPKSQSTGSIGRSSAVSVSEAKVVMQQGVSKQKGLLLRPSESVLLREAFCQRCGKENHMGFVDFENLLSSCLIIGGRLSLDDARTIFVASRSAGESALTFKAFLTALRRVAERKGVSEESVFSAVRLGVSSPTLTKAARASDRQQLSPDVACSARSHRNRRHTSSSCGKSSRRRASASDASLRLIAFGQTF
jgi:Ca2+-binding EF-hand superfamily protein